MACTKQSFRILIDSIVTPVFAATTNNVSSVSVHSLSFLNNMWAGYSLSGCSWFQNRVTHWQSILANVGNPTGNVALRMLAKIEWAQQQHIACGCPGAPPMITGSGSSAKIGIIDKTIKSFDLDFSDIKAAGEKREFSILGDDGAEFNLEIKNSAGSYYNFTTNTFTSTKVSLDGIIENGGYRGSIKFPNIITTDTVNGAVSAGVKVVMDTAVASTMAVGDKVTGNTYLNTNHVTVAALDPDGDNANEFSLSEAVALDDDLSLSFTGDDQYDFSITANPGTKHVDYEEVRFGDNTIDLNSSIGSNSLVMKKVAYQYADLFLTLSMHSVSGGIVPSASTDSVVTIRRGGRSAKTAFSITASSASTASFTIKKQPATSDILAFVQPVIGSAPEDLPGEDIYPSVSNTDTVDGVIVGGGSVVKVVMDTNVADKMAVGDKITAAVATDTVDGAVTSGTVVTMDNNVAGKMAIGDRITSSSTNVVNDALFNKQIITVASFVDGEAKQFNLSTALAIVDGATLTFSPKCNRSLTTVAVLNPDTDNVKEFSMSQNVGLVDGVTLSFSNQMNYQWPADNIDKIQSGMSVLGTNVTSSTSVGEYEDTITLFANTENERIVTKNRSLSTVTKNQTPTVTKGLVTAQPGNIIFDKQQKLVLASDTITINGYGLDTISTLSGYDIMFTDLKIALTPVTTTTTAASVSSTSVVLAARDGILNGTSTVSGIGIDSSSAVPTVSSGASATGAGTVVLSAAQTLESGITLTFGGAGKVATITGNIEVLKAGTSNQTLRFDIDKLLTSA